jgi:hypothetical protein
MQNHELGAYVT